MYVNKNKTKEDKHLAGVCKEYTFMHVHKHSSKSYGNIYIQLSVVIIRVFLSI